MPRQPRQQRLLQNAVPAVPARAAYAPDTTCRMADRTVKQLCELVVGDCILDAFGRYQVITAVEQVNTDAHFCVEAYYVDGVASVDPVTVCVGPGTSLPLTTTVSPTILKQTRKSGAHYRSLNAFQLSEEQGISTEIAVYRSLPPIYRGIRPDQLEEVMVTVNARCNDLLGRILYHQLYSHEYAAYKQKLPAMIKRVHMRRAPMRGAIDPATWPAGREMPLSWTDLARAVWLDMPEPRPVFAGHDGTNWAADLSYLVFLWLADGSRKMTVIHQKHSELGLQLLTRIRTVAARLRMCVSVTLHPAFHPVTNAPWGHMMRIALKKEAGRGDTIFEKMLQATNLWEAKEYDDVITHMLLVDSEDVRAAAVGGMLDGDGTVYRFEGEVYRIAKTADDPVHHWVARDNRRALGDRTADVNLSARRFRDHVLFRVVHYPAPAALVCICMRLLDENQAPEVLDEVAETTPPFPLDLPTFMTQDGLVLHGAHPIVGA